MDPLAPDVAIITAALSEPRYDLAMFPDSVLASSRIINMFSSKVSIGVLPGLDSYLLPSFPNFANSSSTASLPFLLILEISNFASGGRSSSSIPVVKPIDVHMEIVILVILSRNSAPASGPWV